MTHFTELSPCQTKGQPPPRPFIRKAALEVPSVSRLWAMWPAYQRPQINKPGMSFEHVAPISSIPVAWSDHLIEAGSAIPVFPHVLSHNSHREEPELMLKAKMSNTFDPDHINRVHVYSIQCQGCHSQSGSEPKLPDFQSTGFNFKRRDYTFFLKFDYQNQNLSNLKIKSEYILDVLTELFLPVGERPFNEWPWNKSLAKEKT